MDEVAAREQFHTLNEFAGTYDREHRFLAVDICHILKSWLGEIYVNR